MPSSWTPSLRFEQQFTGENINLWGDKLNAVLARADQSIAGWTQIALTAATYSLSTANAGADEARSAMLKFTGAPTTLVTVTVPSVSKVYAIWNASGQIVRITTGAGATVDVDDGDIVQVIIDGTNVKPMGYAGLTLKDYITSFAASAGAVPSPLGNAGKFLFAEDDTTVIWRLPMAEDLGDYETAILGAQVALAVVL